MSKVVDDFSDLPVSDDLLRGVFAYGFEKPSNVQRSTILPILEGEDAIIQAQSGSGKTAVFSIAALNVVKSQDRSTQVIVLSPTRELAEQTAKVLKSLGDFMHLSIDAAVGGKKNEEVKNTQIISGTPGRVLQLAKELKFSTTSVKLFILDEADEMFSRGFKSNVLEIHRLLPINVQVVLVSATLPDEVNEVIEKLNLRNPFKFLVDKSDLTLKEIKQFKILIEKEAFKFDVLCDLYETLRITQSVIFCNTKQKVDVLANKMKDYAVVSMHGDMSQKERDTVMSNFRSGSSRILITTDLCGRGLDVQQVSLVICYDIPNSKEFYLHRIGRSGRFGRKGVAVVFVVNGEEDKIEDIEKHYGIRILEMPENIQRFL
jgi:ATP-dependent RNA helicase